jgi:hypothetical protein
MAIAPLLLEWTMPPQAPLEVEIFNASGLLVERRFFPSAQAFQLDLRFLPAGIYYLSLQVAGQRYSLRVLRQ